MLKVNLAKKFNDMYLKKRTGFTPKATNQNSTDSSPYDNYTPNFKAKKLF